MIESEQHTDGIMANSKSAISRCQNKMFRTTVPIDINSQV